MDENERQKHVQWAKYLIDNPTLTDKVFDETFEKYDKNKDGTFNIEEFFSFMDDVYKISGFKSGIKEESAKMIFGSRDYNGNGKLEKEEFKIEFSKGLHRIVAYNKNK